MSPKSWAGKRYTVGSAYGWIPRKESAPVDLRCVVTPTARGASRRPLSVKGHTRAAEFHMMRHIAGYVSIWGSRRKPRLRTHVCRASRQRRPRCRLPSNSVPLTGVSAFNHALHPSSRAALLHFVFALGMVCAHVPDQRLLANWRPKLQRRGDVICTACWSALRSALGFGRSASLAPPPSMQEPRRAFRRAGVREQEVRPVLLTRRSRGGFVKRARPSVAR